MIAITTHAARRVRKRMGIPKRSVRRVVENAWEHGTRHYDVSGAFGEFVRNVAEKYQHGDLVIVYADFLFIFDQETLLTCYPIKRKVMT